MATPILIEIDKQKVKVLQAVAGLRCSYLLMDNFHIMGLGTSSSFQTHKNANFHSIELLHVSTP